MGEKITIKKISNLEATLKNKERFNPYVSGHGVYKSKKYPIRAKKKEDIRKEINQLTKED